VFNREPNDLKFLLPRPRFFDRPAVHVAVLLAYVLSWGGAVGHVEERSAEAACECGDGPVLTCGGCESDGHHHHARPLHHSAGCSACRVLAAGEAPAGGVITDSFRVDRLDRTAASVAVLSDILLPFSPRGPPLL
jgi:hypothetical protein